MPQQDCLNIEGIIRDYNDVHYILEEYQILFQEDLLTEDMVGCGVTKKSRYGVESYDYTIQYRLNDNFIPKKVFTNSNELENERTSNKRRHVDRGNVKLRLGKRVNSHQQQSDRQEPKFLPDLVVKSEDNLEDVALDIAEKLNEEKKELVGQYFIL